MTNSPDGIKRDCHFYSCGPSGILNWPSAPSEYGSRCNFYDKFFDSKDNNPDCSTCNGDIAGKKLVELVIDRETKKFISMNKLFGKKSS